MTEILAEVNGCCDTLRIGRELPTIETTQPARDNLPCEPAALWPDFLWRVIVDFGGDCFFTEVCDFVVVRLNR